MRGLAVVAVMVFHLAYSQEWAPGGAVGVDIFFVLSGFLITSLLVQEWTMAGGISLRRFYQRRALRLIPALAFFLAVYTSIALTLDAYVAVPPTDRLFLHLAAILTYVYNWLFVLELPRSPGLGQLWSLSIEEQFYLVWPACMLVLFRFSASTRLIATAGTALLSASLPLITDGTYARVYWGTDFRMHELLWGSFLGQLFMAGAFERAEKSRLFGVAVVTSAFFMTIVVLLVSQPFVKFGPLISVAAGFLVLGAAIQSGTLLSSRVLVYVGRRSYALYLWHAALGFWVGMIPAFVCSFVAAEVSYRLVERPALTLKNRLGSPTRNARSAPEHSRGGEHRVLERPS